MAELKDQLHRDLTTAIKSRDELTASTLRMALTAVTTEEVACKVARQLTDEEVLTVLGREAKKRHEAASAYDDAGRESLAERERAELGVLERYLPAQLADDDLAALVATAVAEVGAAGPGDMGRVMKVVQPRVAGRAAGGRIAGEVRRQLSS